MLLEERVYRQSAMREHLLEREQLIPAPLDRVFAFFSDAANLQRLTPAYLNFRILTPLPIVMRVGTLIDYRISLHGLPLRWRTRISVWEPGVRFVDEQLKGPYRLWIHEHTFEATSDGTIARDSVRYAHFGGPLVHRYFIRPKLEEIFDFRKAAMGEVFRSGTAV